jgi:hypothetical protein
MSLLDGRGASILFAHRRSRHRPAEGAELPNLATARREVMAAAREILAGALIATREDVPVGFLIADAAGEVLDAVFLREILPRFLRE